MGNRKGFSLLTILLSAFVMGLLVYLIVKHWPEIAAFPWHLNLRYLTLVLFFHSLALGITFWVWHLMVARLSGFREARLNFRFYYLSTLAKRLPTALPYIGGRLALYKKVGVPGAVVVTCILMENILIGVAGAITFLLFLPFYSNVPYGVALPISVGTTILVIALIARPQLLSEFINWLLKRLKKQGLDQIPDRRDILIWTGLYILPWLFAGASLYFAPKALTTTPGPNLIDSLEVSTLATMVTLINFILPSGMGLKELTSTALLSIWMPISSALVISLVYRIIHTINEIVWALGALLVPYQFIESAKIEEFKKLNR